MSTAPRSEPPRACALLVVLAACGAVDRPEDWHASLPASVADGSEAPGPFDPLRADAIWGVGDRVDYRIDVDAAGERTGFDFYLETLELPPPDPRNLLYVHPVHGRVLTLTAEEHCSPGNLYLGEGIARVRAELRGDDGSGCGGELYASTLAHCHVEAVDRGLGHGVHEMFATLFGLDGLHTELLRVIRPPSAWSVMRRLGRIDVALTWPENATLTVVDAVTPFGRLPTVWCPFTITANGQPALDGRIQFTWTRSPLLLAAGVLRVDAWHPDDAARRLTIRLTSARRGVPADAPDPDDLDGGIRRGMTTADVCDALGCPPPERRDHGVLADGRCVEWVVFDGPSAQWHTVLHDGRVVYTECDDTLTEHFLALRGFTSELRAREETRHAGMAQHGSRRHTART